MAHEPTSFIQRGDRKPLYVQVLTQPALRGCWSVNLSRSGIGLVASPASPQEGPREGQVLELELTLPGERVRIAARGEVRWRHDHPGPSGGTTAALGVSFHHFEGDGQVRVVRYLREHHLAVGVVLASAADEKLIRAALEADFQLIFAASDAELEQVLASGHLSCVVVAGEDGERGAALVAKLWADRSGAGDALAGSSPPPGDLSRRLVLASPSDPSVVLSLFNWGALHRFVPRPLEAAPLREAVLGACREHEMRIEQHRMALELERNLLRERAKVAPEPSAPGGEGPGLKSEAMRRVLKLAKVAAPHRVAVLLQGETGTGKEVLASTLHRLSNRRNAPFVVQDCGALSETLLESELFGHVKGAFTGAVSDHPGLFVLADSGTIFLDEIENTTANFQTKLLRAIETGDVRPVGGAQVRRVDVRVIAASNRDLGDEVRQGRFRSDLFFRLNSFTLQLPPLRERPEDLDELADHFLALFNRALDRSAAGFSPGARAALHHHGWPGNVRELRNVVERAVLLGQPGRPIDLPELPDALAAHASGAAEEAKHGSLRDKLASYERELIQQALEKAGGVIRRAAAQLQTDPVTFARRARRYGLPLRSPLGGL
ncbi:MAG TPA: sigma 54-interacting transcriptional regulator [Myxococcaceae bacterium]|jgi:DNA-binding NtrC family response regulator